MMTKLMAIALVVGSFLLVAPIVERSTSESTQVFVAVGNAEAGGGGE
jgi:hypothetical protein